MCGSVFVYMCESICVLGESIYVFLCIYMDKFVHSGLKLCVPVCRLSIYPLIMYMNMCVYVAYMCIHTCTITCFCLCVHVCAYVFLPI